MLEGSFLLLLCNEWRGSKTVTKLPNLSETLFISKELNDKKWAGMTLFTKLLWTACYLALWPLFDLSGRSCKLYDLILKLNPYQPLFLHDFSKFYTLNWLWLFFGKFMCAEILQMLRRLLQYSLLPTSRVYKKSETDIYCGC